MKARRRFGGVEVGAMYEGRTRACSKQSRGCILAAEKGLGGHFLMAALPKQRYLQDGRLAHACLLESLTWVHFGKRRVLEVVSNTPAAALPKQR